MIRPGASAADRRARSGQPGRLGIVRLKGEALEEKIKGITYLTPLERND